jgi:hypothetical protein
MPTITKPNLYFDVVTYTGTGATQTITGLNFQPDFVWIKNRTNGANWHVLTDVVRGVQKEIYTNSTAAEATLTTTGVNQFNSNGFQILGNSGDYNRSGDNYVAWCWKANGSGSTNTSGSITSTVSANTTSGFSIVTYTGNATSNQTFGHGLGAKVDFAIIKSRSAVSSPAWMVWHRSVCSGNGKALALEETNAIQGPFGTPIWDSSNTSTQASSTTFTIGANTTINASGATYVAYCFAEVAGYSKFGSYTGNGSTDGVFVYTGFRPAYVLIKSSGTADSWIVLDAARDTYNVEQRYLIPNASDAEGTAAILDFVSNGFKLRFTGSSGNSSGINYIFAAFATSPFKYSLAR